MDKIRVFWERHWQLIFGYAAALGLLALAFGYKLLSLVPAASAGEAETLVQASSIGSLIHNPLYLPYKVVLFLMLKLPVHPLLAARLTSAAFGVLAVWLFYNLAKNWYTRRVAILSTSLLAVSSWLLHMARLGKPLILTASILALLWGGLMLRSYPARRRIVFLLAALACLVAYVPGFIWFLLAAAVWQRRYALQAISRMPANLKALLVLLAVLLLTPLTIGLVLEPSQLRLLAGIPESVPNLNKLLRNTVNIPIHLFYHGPEDASVWLAGTPLIDFFGTIMFVLGIYALRFNVGLDRIKSLIGLLVVSIFLLIAGTVSIAILLPLVFLAIASGIAFMLQQWFTVFPRNPLAKYIAVIIIASAVGLSGFYQLRHYFVAWRHAPETQAAFTEQIPPNLLQ